MFNPKKKSLPRKLRQKRLQQKKLKLMMEAHLLLSRRLRLKKHLPRKLLQQK